MIPSDHPLPFCPPPTEMVKNRRVNKNLGSYINEGTVTSIVVNIPDSNSDLFVIIWAGPKLGSNNRLAFENTTKK